MRWTPKMDEQIISMWREGWSSLHISRKLDVSAAAVRKRLKRVGQPRLSHDERSLRHRHATRPTA